MKTLPALLLGCGLSLASFGRVAGAESATQAGPGAKYPVPEAGKPAASPAAKRSRLVLDGTAITEYTDEGRKCAVPTAEQPIYFLTHSGGQHDFGQVNAGQKPLPEGSIEAPLTEALTANHYLPAAGGRQPSLVLIYIWGTYGRPDPLLDDPGYKNLLGRTALIGGRKFAGELKEALLKDETSEAAMPSQSWGMQMSGLNPAGASSLFKSFSPLEAFRTRDAKTTHLLELVSDECHYVVVSAYDFAALARGEKRLLWHTKLSACSRGRSLNETVSALLAGGTGVFGKEMNEPEFFSKLGH